MAAPLPLFDDVKAALLAVTADRNGTTLAAVDALRDKLRTRRRTAQDAAPVFPDLDAPDFHERLQAMRNFYSMGDARRVLKESGVRTRTLLKHQRFVKAYLSPATGYNGLLLVHATGSGKTCSAVSVAEMYRAQMRHPALVLTKTLVRAGFEAELARLDEAVWTAGEGWSIPLGCGTAQYQRVVALVKDADPRQVKDALDRIMAKNYRFAGYEEFSNEAERVERAGGTDALRAAFSDRVIIVDEAHNLRRDVTAKRSSDVLMRLLRMCSNVKLLLLTATPMFDRPKEIVFLLNLLRVNDGRAPVEADDLFDAAGGLMDAAALERAAQGYVSFARGADDRDFPARLAAHEALGAPVPRWPKTQYDGSPVPAAAPGALIPVTPCELSASSAAVVRSLLGVGPADPDGSAGLDGSAGPDDPAGLDGSAGPDDPAGLDDPVLNRLAPAAQASNAVIAGLYGERAIAAAFRTSTVGGVVQYEHRDPAARPFSRDALGVTAPKIANVVRAVAACEGIAFVYTYWIHGGALPVALALEEHGFTRFGGPPLLKGADRERGVRAPAPQYVLLTGRADLMAVSAKEAVRLVTRQKNRDGSQIKVIVGTNTTTEGVNFQNVREVHILDAWWNLARSEQVVGRAVRYGSHLRLEPERRNVTVYYHAAHLPRGVEGVDHYMYRRASEKQREIERVLSVLRSTAVDCAWNSDQGQGQGDGSGTRRVRTSQGRVFTPRAAPAGLDAVPCKHAKLLAPAAANAALYQPLSDDVDVVRWVLEAAFARRERLSRADIGELLPGAEPDVVDASLAAMLRDGHRVSGGRLALYGHVYAVDRGTRRPPPEAVAFELPHAPDAAPAVEAVAADFADAARRCGVRDAGRAAREAALDRAATYPRDPKGPKRETIKAPAAIVDTEGAFKLLSPGGKPAGRSCATLSVAATSALAAEYGVRTGDASKAVVCRAIEVAMRKRGLVARSQS